MFPIMPTALLFALIVSLAGGHAIPPQNADRVYSLVRMNGQPVPGAVRFRSTKGTMHWLRVEESVLRLKRDGSFVASARFYRELLREGAPAPRPANLRLLNDAAQGRYSIRRDTLVLQVAKRKDSAGGIVRGLISGNRVRIRHTLKDGNLRHNVDVEFRFDPTIW